MARILGIGVVIAVLGLIAAGVGLRFYMGRVAESRLRPGEDQPLAALHGTLPGNAFLACPPGYCRVDGAAASPVFATDADRLYWAFVRLATGEPRIAIVTDDPRRRRVALIQRSALFRFPDIVIAEIVKEGAERSSLALYSRARYGRYDFGANRRRVADWLGRLRSLAQYSPPVPSPGRGVHPGGG
jgi:uncharacterized protein (DUF1499 family)